MPNSTQETVLKSITAILEAAKQSDIHVFEADLRGVSPGYGGGFLLKVTFSEVPMRGGNNDE